MTNNAKNSSSIGLIGLGAMGLGMASSLRRSGYALNVCDVRFEAAENFALAGGKAYKTPAELAKVSDIIISVVVN
ncbi:MAG: NAD(P)-dependent oxidoreductase, partial [Burkholderiaceae bacterium]|nr:NAD(P)-dependent oxidoreductase [Burkholderiaceae bacterium]